MEHGYGGSGYVLCAWNGSDVVSLNGSYVQSVTRSGANYCCWTPDTNDPRATLNPATDTERRLLVLRRHFRCQYQPGEPRRMALSIAWRSTVWIGMVMDRGGRSQTLDVLNATTGQSELNGGPVAVSNFVNGTWVVFYFTGMLPCRLPIPIRMP